VSRTRPERRLATLATVSLLAVVAFGSASAQRAPSPAPPPSPRAAAPVDLTGYWVSQITEDWAWRMQTPPKGDYASVPLNDEGKRVADTWRPETDGACLGFGAPVALRVPTRAHITWLDDSTLEIETDNGEQTRRLHFGAPSAIDVARSLQGYSRAEWLQPSGGGEQWASLKVVTTGLTAGWLRPNGVPYSENAELTEYFDWFVDGDEPWFTVTTMVEDPKYLTEPFVISSNFKRERDKSKWRPAPCKS
jgi:hypothetical protein